MPELPEVEHLRRSLEPILIDASVRDVCLSRPSIVRETSRRPSRRALLVGGRVVRLHRHGKQLAIETDAGPVLCVHLGMSGQLQFAAAGHRLPRHDHVHCVWRIETTTGRGRLVFRDPRRFGGLWVFESMEALRTRRWCTLGPDALTIPAAALRARLARTGRAVKAALLDQSVVAGVGNIYADEALFDARVHPLDPASRLTSRTVTRLAESIRRTLRQAVRAGGSTIRDYADANGSPGWFATQHLVYGRAGDPCCRCESPLDRLVIAQRTTVCCPICQPRGA